jgi:hypothetical protein
LQLAVVREDINHFVLEQDRSVQGEAACQPDEELLS